MNNTKLHDYFSLMYESYINGNRNDHRERYFKMTKQKQLEYILYLFSVSGREFESILENLNA